MLSNMYLFPLLKVVYSKKKEYAPRNQILPFGANCFKKRAQCAGKQTESHKGCHLTSQSEKYLPSISFPSKRLFVLNLRSDGAFLFHYDRWFLVDIRHNLKTHCKFYSTSLFLYIYQTILIMMSKNILYAFYS